MKKACSDFVTENDTSNEHTSCKGTCFPRSIKRACRYKKRAFSSLKKDKMKQPRDTYFDISGGLIVSKKRKSEWLQWSVWAIFYEQETHKARYFYLFVALLNIPFFWTSRQSADLLETRVCFNEIAQMEQLVSSSNPSRRARLTLNTVCLTFPICLHYWDLQ